MTRRQSFLAPLVALTAFAALLLLHNPLLVFGATSSYSYNVPGCVVTTSIDASNNVKFTLTLSRLLVGGESLSFSLGPNGTPAGIVYSTPAAHCLASNLATSNDITFLTSTSGFELYSILTIVSSSGCAFVADRTTPLPITFQGFLLITFTSGSIVQAVYFGQVNLIQTTAISTNPTTPTTYTTTITPVVQGTVTIADQQLSGVVYRLGAPTELPPLMATPNAYMALTFQVTSDLPFHYWFSTLEASLCLTSGGCSDLEPVSYYNGASPPDLTTPIPSGDTVQTGISFGSSDWGGYVSNKLISFWVHIPPTSATTCPAAGDCTISCVLTLLVDVASVTTSTSKPFLPSLQAHRRQMTVSTRFQLARSSERGAASHRTLADTTTSSTLAAGASIGMVFVPVNGVTSAGLARVDSPRTTLQALLLLHAAMLACATLSLASFA